MKHLSIVMSVLAVMVGLFGCSSNLVANKWSEAKFTPHPVVAIFPFDNLSDQDQVGLKLASYLQTFLAADDHINLVESGTVYDCLRRHRIRSASLITSAQMDSISGELKINYFVTGAVLEYREVNNTYLGKVPQVSFNTRVVDCSTRNTVWAGASNGSGDQGEVVFGLGAIRSSDDLARHMVSKVAGKIIGLFQK